jgi:hypothetical protein
MVGWGRLTCVTAVVALKRSSVVLQWWRRWRGHGSVVEEVPARGWGGGGEGVPTRRWRQGSGGGGDDRVPAAAACAPVDSLMAVRWRQCAREMKFCEVIQAERRVLDLYGQVSKAVLCGTAIDISISTAVVPMNRCWWLSTAVPFRTTADSVPYTNKNMMSFFPFFFLFL